MAFSFTTNQTPATGAVAMFLFISNLLSAGWAVKASSDGATYNSTGNQILTGSSGANGLANNSAWVRLQSPLLSVTHREFTIQRGATNTNWRVVYSPSSGFTGGSPSATIVPSATDGVVIFGSGTDAAPTMATIFNTDGSYRLNTGAGDVTTKYSFWMLCTATATGVTATGFALEGMLTGSYPTQDLDPCIVYAGTPSNSNIFGSDLATGSFGFLGSLLSAAFVNIPALSFNVTATVYVPANVGGQNAWSGSDDVMNVVWGRRTSPYGIKGYGATLLWDSVSHNNLDTISINSTRDRLYVNGCLLPWDGSAPVL